MFALLDVNKSESEDEEMNLGYPGLEGHHKGPYREKQGDITLLEKRHIGRRQRLEGCNCQPRNVGSHRKLEEAQSGFSSRTSGGRRWC